MLFFTSVKCELVDWRKNTLANNEMRGMRGAQKVKVSKTNLQLYIRMLSQMDECLVNLFVLVCVFAAGWAGMQRIHTHMCTATSVKHSRRKSIHFRNWLWFVANLFPLHIYIYTTTDNCMKLAMEFRKCTDLKAYKPAKAYS